MQFAPFIMFGSAPGYEPAAQANLSATINGEQHERHGNRADRRGIGGAGG